MSKLLSTETLAKRWDMSPRTLEQWRYQGRGPRYVKLGNLVRYRLEDVEAAEERQLHANTAGPLSEAE